MEKPPKTSESENIKKVFNLPGKQQVEWEFNPRTGEIISLAKKDAEGNTVEFYNLEREEIAQAYENYGKILAQPSKLKRETPVEKQAESNPAEDKTLTNWRPYAKQLDPKTNTTIVFFYNAAKSRFLEVVQNNNNRTLLRYIERDFNGDIINFENFDADARNPSDLQTQLDQAKKDHTYFKELENSGWKPTEQ